MSRFNVKGLDELNANINKLKDITREVAEKEIADIALDLSSRASNSAPVKLGDLRGELAVPKKVYNGWQIGSSLPYTRIQHESLDFNHPLGGGPKFLENPFNENKAKYERAIKEAIKNAIIK